MVGNFGLAGKGARWGPWKSWTFDLGVWQLSDMSKSTGCAVVAALSLLCFARLDAPVLASETEAEVSRPAVPPGQEDLLLEMLGKGANLPDGCKLKAGEIDHTVIEATYDCPLGEVVLELAHPSEAHDTDKETEQFVFTVLSGSPPVNLADAVGDLIRSHEGEFEWKWPAEEPAEQGEEAGDEQ
jgi:hypothetical protein